MTKNQKKVNRDGNWRQGITAVKDKGSYYKPMLIGACPDCYENAPSEIIKLRPGLHECRVCGLVYLVDYKTKQLRRTNEMDY